MSAALDWILFVVWLCDTVGSGLGFVFNALLLYVTFRTSDRTAKIYSRMFVASALYDMIFCVVEMLTQHQLRVRDGILFFFPRAAFETALGYDFLPYIYTLHVYLCIVELFVIPAQYHYRLNEESTCALVRNLVIASGCAFFCSLLSTWAILTALRTRGVSCYLDRIDAAWLTHGTHTYFYALDVEDLQANLYLYALFTFTSLALAVTAFYMVKIVRCVRNGLQATSHITKRTKQMQNQFTKALLVQALNGLVLAVLPISLVSISPLTHTNVETVGLLVLLPLSWLPVANSFTTLLVVRPFREFLVQRSPRIGFLSGKRGAPSTSTS